MQALVVQTEENKIKSWIYFACQANGVSAFSSKIIHRFRKNFTRILGQALATRNLIEISQPLWERASEEQRKQVVVHEACHLIAHCKHGNEIKPHGPEWKKCMVAAGASPLRCHNVNRDGLKRQYVKYAVQCACTSVWVGHVKAAKVRANKFSCKRCKNKVKLTGETYRPGTLAK